MRAVVTKRKQVTIPKPLRDRLGIQPQTVLEFHEENGRLIAEKVTMDDQVSRVFGCLDIEGDTDELIAEMRGRK